MPNLCINNLESLPEAARKFLNKYKDKRIFAFFGDLGSGKTTFIKAICHAMHVADAVSSPTFSLINEYSNSQGQIIYHMDFYRINSIDEALDIGIEEYFSSNHYCFIEWPEKIEPLLPPETVIIGIKADKQNKRVLTFH